jgi:type II secretory pathway component PulF
MHSGVARDLRGVLDAVHAGRPLSAALRESDRFDPFAVAVVQAGEGNGMLDEALTRLASHYERSEDLRTHVRAQLLHPVVMGILSGLSLLMLLWFMVPRFFTALGEPIEGLPLAARLLAMASGAVAEGWRLWFPVAVGVVASCRLWISLPFSRRWWHQWRLRLPRIGAVEAALSTAEFSRAFGVLLSSGAPVPDALSAAREVVTNEALGTALDQAAAAARRGARLAEALSGTLPPLAVELLATGEERGRLGQISTRVAMAYDAEAERALRSLSRFLEPGLVVGFALLAGYVVFALLQALHFVNAGLA